MDKITINFANETEGSLIERGITSLDFIRQFVGKEVIATEISRLSGCGEAFQDGLLFELVGSEDAHYALLMNAPTVYSRSYHELMVQHNYVQFLMSVDEYLKQ